MKNTFCIAKSEKDCPYFALTDATLKICQFADWKTGICRLGKGVSKAAKDRAVAGKGNHLNQ